MDILSAARMGDINKLKELVSTGLDINQKNERGHSALMIAAYNAHYSAAEFLIQQGADVNSVDESGNSILMGVVFKGHAPLFELLIKHGALLDVLNKKNQSALDLAVMFGRRNLIFRINQLQNTDRSASKLEQIKTWAQQIIPESIKS